MAAPSHGRPRAPLARAALLCVGVLVASLVAGPVLPATAAGDPLRPQQWALDRIAAERSWTRSTGAQITIAVIDTGIDLDHPDLEGKIVGGYDCSRGCRAGGDDDNGHGSHVAGIAAAATGNGAGIAGTAPGAALLSVKVLDARGAGTCNDVADGVRHAADLGARVINLSLGPDVRLDVGVLGLAQCLERLESAVDYAWDRGAVPVAAAGNQSLPASFYTGTSNLIVVGATGPDDRVARYSNGMLGVDVYAPGGESSRGCDERTCVLSTYRDGAYALAEGTSMAAPHVSGVVALMLASGVAQPDVRSRLRDTADRTPDGYPRVNAARAVGVDPRVEPSASDAGGSAESMAGGDGSAAAGGRAASPRANAPPRRGPVQPGGADRAAPEDGPASPPIDRNAAAGVAGAFALALLVRWGLRRAKLLR